MPEVAISSQDVAAELESDIMAAEFIYDQQREAAWFEPMFDQMMEDAHA